MALTASQLRQDIYRILDRILDSGVPVDVRRKGRRLRIQPVGPAETTQLEELEPHPDALEGDPEDLVHLDWSSEWRP